MVTNLIKHQHLPRLLAGIANSLPIYTISINETKRALKKQDNRLWYHRIYHLPSVETGHLFNAFAHVAAVTYIYRHDDSFCFVRVYSCIKRYHGHFSFWCLLLLLISFSICYRRLQNDVSDGGGALNR